MSKKAKCSQCIKYIEKIYLLEQKVKSLQAKVRYQERKITEGYFTSQTPSSKKPFKSNTPAAEKKNIGGAKAGHKGNGRKSLNAEQANVIKRVKTFELCPCCNVKLAYKGLKKRTVFDIEPVEIKKVLYELEVKRCERCEKKYIAQAPGVLPKFLFGNNLLTFIATEHYLNGIPLGHLEKKLNIDHGAMIKAMHKLSTILAMVPDQLIEKYRQAPVKHADETGWRNDGKNGYAWLFTTPEVSVFRFRKTRSASVAKKVFGEKKLPGVLVVDRYNGYNKAPCKIQYCYAHLFRKVQDLEKEFPENKEVKEFVQTIAPLLAEAMNLRSLPLDKKEFMVRAANTKSEIIKNMNTSAKHAGIQKIQDIFRENKDRLYHWAKNQAVPADNNFAERELRPLVIARKLSFGSHSDAGLKTRKVIMSTLVTLKKKEKDKTFARFSEFLDLLAGNGNVDPFQSLFE